MMSPLRSVVATLLLAMALAVTSPRSPAEEPPMATDVHAFELTANSGEAFPLAAQRGKVLLLVNTASACGLTPQYAGLQELHERFHQRGLMVIAVPANDFGQQEPGTDAEIATFCQTHYAITFPLMAKVSVKGTDIHPLYQWLTTESTQPGAISWNFTKFLIDRDGTVLQRFDPKRTPTDAELIAAIEAALAASD